MTTKKLILTSLLLIITTFSLRANNNTCSEAKKIHVNVFPDIDSLYFDHFSKFTLSSSDMQCSDQDTTELSDAWFYFDAPESTLVINNNWYTELYKGDECGNLTFIRCIKGNGEIFDDFIENERYYLRVVGLNYYGFSIAVHVPPQNFYDTDCTNAKILKGDTTFYQHFGGCLIEDATLDTTNCEVNMAGDIWYKFNAEKTFYRLEKKGYKSVYGQIQIFQGTCNELELIYCNDIENHDWSSSGYFYHPFQIGKEYYLRLSAKSGYIIDSELQKYYFSGVSPNPNSLCTGAYHIEADSIQRVCYQLSDKHLINDDSVELPPCWEDDEQNDAWYEFTARNKKYNVFSKTGNLAVYSGNCDGFTLLGCGNEIFLETLSLGEKYYIRAVGSGEVCLDPAAINSSCVEAIDIEPREFNYNKTKYSMLYGGISPQSCDTTDVNDIWFSFTATSTSVVFDVDYPLGQYNLAIFEGTCDSLNLIQCINNASTITHRVDELIIGQKYFFRYSSSLSKPIGFRLMKIPSNEYFSKASKIEGDTCVFGNAKFINEDTTSFQGESYGFGKGLWYEFVPKSEVYSIDIYDGQFDYKIFKKTASGKIKELVKFYNSNFYEYLHTNIYFHPGETYYIQVLGYNKGFKLCLSEITYSSNYKPSEAQVLLMDSTNNCGEFEYPTLVTNLWENDSINCLPNRFQASKWYYFEPDQESVQISGQYLPPHFELYEVDSLTDIVFNCPVIEGNSNLNYDMVLEDLNPEKGYLLRFRKINHSPSSWSNHYSFCLNNPPINSNDDFFNAKEVDILPIYSECENSPHAFYSANNQPTDSTLFASSCNISRLQDNDVWFTFVATDSILGFKLNPNGSSQNYYELYSWEEEQLYCLQYEYLNEYYFSLYRTRFKNLKVGERYYLRFPQNLSPQPSYLMDFCVYTIPPPPINNEIEGAITLIPSESLTDCYTDETYHLNMSENSVWFKFVATDSSHQLVSKLHEFLLDATIFEIDEDGNPIDSTEHYYYDTADNLYFHKTDDKSAWIRAGGNIYGFYNFKNLHIGKEYHIRLGVNGYYELIEDHIPITYQICLKTLPSPPKNNSVNDPFDLDIIDGEMPNKYYYATLSEVNYIDDPIVETCIFPTVQNRYNYAEAWFQFKPAQTAQKIIIDNQAQLTGFTDVIEVLPYFSTVKLSDLTTYISVYGKDSEDNYSSIVCDVPVDSFYIVSDLLVNETYLLKVYYNCINYLTDLNFGIGISTSIDQDMDGFKFADDCDDNNPDVNPDQTEIVYNGIDDDCNPETLDDDLDQDGFVLADDCDDENPNINPSQEEITYNGIDDDCNPTTLDDDLDQDGFVLADDCDDENPNINPNQEEITYNGIDDDCNPTTLDDDLDQDGFVLADDCDDENPNINPNQEEITYNGIDDDCNPTTLDDDLDQDGFVLADDCDDENPNINPDATEIPDNGIDEDCDGLDSTTGIHELMNSTIRIYPNPVSDILHIKVEGKLDFKVSLFDLKGHLLLMSENKAMIDVHSIMPGTYILEIEELKTGKSIIDRIIIAK